MASTLIQHYDAIADVIFTSEVSLTALIIFKKKKQGTGAVLHPSQDGTLAQSQEYRIHANSPCPQLGPEWWG